MYTYLTMLFYQDFLTNSMLLTLGLILISYVYVKYKFQYWKTKKIPYLTPTFPHGSFEMPLIKKHGIPKDIYESYKIAQANDWKCLGLYAFAGTPNLLITDLDILKKILSTNFDHFTYVGSYSNEKYQPISTTLFTLDGSKWKNLRSKFSTSFTSGKLRNMLSAVVHYACLVKETLNARSLEKEPVEMRSIYSAFSIDLIGQAAFGIECNALKDPQSQFPHICDGILRKGKIAVIRDSFILGLPIFSKYIGICPFSSETERFFNTFVRKIFKHRLEKNLVRKDFFQLLMDMHNEDNCNMNDIVAQSLLIVLAGFITTATTICFSSYEMAINQKIQDKVRKEVCLVLDKYNGEITYESLKEMVYLEQVIEETLRLYAPVPHITRVCVKDYEIPEMNLVIEKGTKLFIPIKGIHHNEKIYTNPKIFDPERFSNEQRNSRHQYAFIPFGMGPRMCLGGRFGTMAAKVCLATVLKDHKLTLNEKTKLPLKLDPYTFIPEALSGVWINVENV